MKLPRSWILLASLVLFPVFGATCLYSANITWGAATGISGDSDVSSNGSLIGAFNLGGSSVAGTTINGTLFSRLETNGAPSVTSGNFKLESSSGNLFGDDAVGFAASPFSNLTADYQGLLSSLSGKADNGTDPVTLTLTLSGLQVGASYEFQWWANNSKFENKTTIANAGNSISLSSNPTGNDGGLGQYAIGAFVADSSGTQTIGFGSDRADLARIYLNGFQLRQLSSSVPDSGTTVALLGLALAGLAFVRRRIA